MQQPPQPAPPAGPRRMPRWALVAGSTLLVVVLGIVWWSTRDASGALTPGSNEPTPTLGLILQGTPGLDPASSILGGAPVETPAAEIPAPPPPAATMDPALLPTLGAGTPVLPNTGSGQFWPCGTPMPDGRVLDEGGPIPCATMVP